eukprot:857517-Rhodomonas_salina.1
MDAMLLFMKAIVLFMEAMVLFMGERETCEEESALAVNGEEALVAGRVGVLDRVRLVQDHA